MKTDFRKISNPLTIIAIFAGLAEINGTVVLGLVPENLQEIFLWFIILFPSILVVVFFLTLNYNPKVLYAPSDFSNEEKFLKNMRSGSEKFDSIQLEFTKDNYKEAPEISEIVRKAEINTYNSEPFLPETRKHLQLANTFMDHLSEMMNEIFEKGVIKELQYGIQAPEYFMLSYSIPKEILKEDNLRSSESIIIRVTENEKGFLNLIAIGKDIIEENPKIFAERIFEYVDNIINNVVDFKKIPGTTVPNSKS